MTRKPARSGIGRASFVESVAASTWRARIRCHHENPLPPRLAVGPWRRQADINPKENRHETQTHGTWLDGLRHFNARADRQSARGGWKREDLPSPGTSD